MKLKNLTLLLCSSLLVLTSHSVSAADSELIDNLDYFEWKNRLILIDSPDSCEHEISKLNNAADEINDRDILWFVLCDTSDTTILESSYSQKANKFAPTLIDQIRKYYFTTNDTEVVLVGKDGGTKYRSKKLSLKEIFDRVDAMPMRQDEMRYR